MMTEQRRNGFVLMFVITALSIIGVAMLVLTNMAATMQFQSHTTYLQACRRNLLASGLAWARQNVQNDGGKILGKTVELDVSKMDIRGSELDVTVGTLSDGNAEVQVSSSCTRGRQTLEGQGKYRIELHDKQETTPGTRENAAGN